MAQVVISGTGPDIQSLIKEETLLRMMLDDRMWRRWEPILTEIGVRETKRLRMAVEGILWKFRTGAPWRDLPSEFGPWQTVFNRFNNWSHTRWWQKIYQAVRGEMYLEWTMMDG